MLGTPFKVHTIDRGTHEQMHRQALNLRDNLVKHLDKYYQLGLFAGSARERADGLGGYDIYISYHGEAIDPQRKGKWKKKRRMQYHPKRSS